MNHDDLKALVDRVQQLMAPEQWVGRSIPRTRQWTADDAGPNLVRLCGHAAAGAELDARDKAALQQLCLLADGGLSPLGKLLVEAGPVAAVVVMHFSVPFVGDMLRAFPATEHTTRRQLLDIARRNAAVPWTTSAEVGNREALFRSVGATSSHGNKYWLTDLGRCLAEVLPQWEPARATVEVPVGAPCSELLTRPVPADQWLERKNVGFYYLPAPDDEAPSVFGVLEALLSELLEEPLERSSYLAWIGTRFPKSSRSAAMVLSTLRGFGLVSDAPGNALRLSAFGSTWLSSGASPVDFVRWATRRCVGFGELLDALPDADGEGVPLKDAAARVGMKGPDASLKFLVAAGLVRTSSGRETIAWRTRTGELLAEELTRLQPEPADVVEDTDASPTGAESVLVALIAENVDAMRDSANPARAEHSLVASAQFLGLVATRIGNEKGAADVLAVEPLSRRALVLDAKTAGNGGRDLSVSRLNAHRERHGAELSIAVAPAFTPAARADCTGSKVLPVEVDGLNAVLRAHAAAPMSFDEVISALKAVAEDEPIPSGEADATALRLVTDALAYEYTLGGEVEPRTVPEIRLCIRSYHHVVLPAEEIEAALAALAMVNAAVESEDGWTLVLAPAVAADRLSALASAVGAAAARLGQDADDAST